MTQTIQAIYENGVLRPLTPLNLSEGTIVEITDVRFVDNPATEDNSEVPPNVLLDSNTEGEH